ncbi:MAG: hypothetical protein HONBIEJF_02701 [Fimbriimonadaceae bacterium]|nr:hypothetical protein [Fimbriimonadaceae bacterium]
MLSAIGLALVLSQPSPTLQDKLTNWLASRHQEGGFPGASVAIIDGDGKVSTACAGVREVGKPEKLMPTDRLLSGSIGKTYFAAAFVEAALEKGISLDRKAADDLGGQAWYDKLPNATTFTYRHLLRHQSGLSEYFQHQAAVDSMKKDPVGARKPEDLLAYLHGDKPLFPAGEKFSYADSNYLVLGLAFKKLFGEDGYDAVTRRYLKPLKLEGTVPSRELRVSGQIPGHSKPLPPFWFTGPTVIDGKNVLNPQFEGWGGGFANTPTALAQWAKALYGGKATSMLALKEIVDGVPSNLGGNQKYGCAVQIRTTEHGPSFGHSGWFPGYLSDMAYFPDLKLAVAVQFNTDDFSKLKGSTFSYLLQGVAVYLKK